MDAKLKALILQLISVGLILLFVLGITYLRGILALYLLSFVIGIIAIVTFIIALIIERNAKKKPLKHEGE
ncbi:MAG: hypothetical protein ACTSQI_05660 [Candidatus Helarchaeota archaeon]